jgi:signal transduction histidine kinase
VLHESEQLKDEFISIAAHELRNPLAAIHGFASMLVVQTALGHGPVLADWQQEAIAEIRSATSRLNTLTTDLLEVTRIQAGRMELHPTPQDLVALVRRCLVRAQATTTRHTLRLEAPAEPVLLEVDGLRLE